MVSPLLVHQDITNTHLWSLHQYQKLAIHLNLLHLNILLIINQHLVKELVESVKLLHQSLLQFLIPLPTMILDKKICLITFLASSILSKLSLAMILSQIKPFKSYSFMILRTSSRHDLFPA